MTDNSIGAEGAIMLSESLKTNATLTELNLSRDEQWNEWRNDNRKEMKMKW